MIKLKSLLYEVDGVRDEDFALVKTHAHKNGYTHQTYRGDTNDGEIFNYTRKERREYGIFTTPVKEVAAIYTGNRKQGTPRKFYVRSPKILDLTQDSLDNMKWVIEWGKSFDEWRDPQTGEEVNAWDVLEGGQMFDYEEDWSSERWMDIQMTAHHKGFDAVILPDYDSNVGMFPSFVVFDEKNIKLADPITYDDNNNPIPIEKRFDRTSNDIRL